MKRSITIMKIGVFLGLLAETYLNAALPSLMVTFNVPAELLQWVTSLYILTMGLSVPISAFLIKRTTHKELFLSSVALFMVGTTLSGLAPSFLLLLIGRIVQAVGASMTLPLMIHSIMVEYEQKEQGKAMGLAMLVVLFAPAIGPTVGALILELFSWRWIFFCTLPLLLILFIWALCTMKQTNEREIVTVDLLSILLSIVGFGSFVFGLQQLLGGKMALFVALSITIVGVVGIGWFVLRQRSLSNPMLNLSPLKQKRFALGAVLITLIHLVVFGSFILLPLYLVQIFKLSPFQAGITLLPGGFLGAMVPSFAGRLYDRYGPKQVVIGGFCLLVAANYLFSLTSIHSSSTIVALIYLLLMGGFGISLTPVQTHSLSVLDKDQLGSGTAILNTLMLVASSMGGSLFVALMAAKSGSTNFIMGISHSYLITTFVALLGLGVSLFYNSVHRQG